MNMSYCRFQNTVIDLEDCLRALEEIDFNIGDLSEDEAKAACRLIEICQEIGGQYGKKAAKQAQAGAVPLTVSQIRDWWASENGLEDCEMCKLTDFLRVVRAVEEKHGIKGGQHG